MAVRHMWSTLFSSHGFKNDVYYYMCSALVYSLKYSFFCGLLEFQKSRQTELCLAYYRVLRGMALVTWRDVVSGTTRKLISFIFAGIKCENCVVVVQKKKLCLTGASLPIVVTSRTRRGIFQCIGFRFTAIQGQKHRNGVKDGSTGLSGNGQSGNHQYIPIYARSILNQKSLCSSSAMR